ncbi:MAG: prepilin peptidase [Candidatus Obscuribacterales bacterium]|nr:prepilin peptidase [Candidatus Obscuribacterales bacterium]
MELLLDLSFLVKNAQVVLFFAFLFGIATGSFLNVLALRSLKEESLLWPPSYCPKCNHRLSPLDNIPVVSWVSLGGKCRYCSAPISWQYPAVELITALTFVAIVYVFLLSPIPYDMDCKDLWQGIAQGLRHEGHVGELTDWRKFGLTAGMLAFACTLITVTVTDFREKLIPHEITYPSMIIGIIFSAVVRQDALGAMAGIGASYIIFDFLAFYGLKIYLKVHGDEEEEVGEIAGSPATAATDPAAPVVPSATDAPEEIYGTTAANSVVAVDATTEGKQDDDPQLPTTIDNRTCIGQEKSAEKATTSTTEEQEEEPLEVMGGGDAVLSAVMSAYLGWQLLVVALCIGFLTGTLMGLVLLVGEMKKAGLLRDCINRSLKFAAIASVSLTLLMGAMVAYMQSVSGVSDSPPGEVWQPVLMMALMGAIGGGLLGMVSVGTRVSKPFPFGPALALGAFIAMFLVPRWLPFY